MKKILIIALIICIVIIGYMVVNNDTDITSDKVLNWLQDYIPTYLDQAYTIESYDVIQNDDGSVDIILHCEHGN